MEYALLQQMHRNIDDYIKQGKLTNRRIVVFGSNEPAERIMEYLDLKGLHVYGLIDNNKKKDGTTLNGVTVTLPNSLLVPKIDDVVVLIASKYYPEMVVQLDSMGYVEGENILKAVEYSAHSMPSLSEEEFDKQISIIKEGQTVYEKIKMAQPNAEKIFVCPLIVLGDAYVGMAYMTEYMQKNNIHDFALILVNRACSKIASLFGFDKSVVSVTREEMDVFLRYAVFNHMDDGRILVLNHRHPYTCRIGEIGNYKEINFMDHFKYSIFGLNEESRPEVPSATRDSEESKKYVNQLFEENGLKKGKTVILLPYAKTATKIDESFWIALAEKLKGQGYEVCTNSGGDGEPAIKGTKELFFDIRYSLETVEAAGVLIGLRSGLCDVLSTAKARKIILYPDRLYGPDTFINFFSLNRMELCDDAIELVVGDNHEEMMNRIMEDITL